MAVSILIVDPDTIYVDLVKERLESHQVLVAGRETVADACNFLEGIRPDLIIVDPAIDSGSELLDVLKDEWHQTPTIVATSQDGAAQAALQSGFDHVIHKSASPELTLSTAVKLLSTTLLDPEQSELPQTLVVDDDPDVVRLFSRILLKHGWPVQRAETIAEAMDTLTNGIDIGLVLLDVVIPKGGGLEFLRQIRALESPPTVILVSGVAEGELAGQALDLGAFDYLVKPVDPSSLMIVVIAATADLQRRSK